MFHLIPVFLPHGKVGRMGFAEVHTHGERLGVVVGLEPADGLVGDDVDNESFMLCRDTILLQGGIFRGIAAPPEAHESAVSPLGGML